MLAAISIHTRRGMAAQILHHRAETRLLRARQGRETLVRRNGLRPGAPAGRWAIRSFCRCFLSSRRFAGCWACLSRLFLWVFIAVTLLALIAMWALNCFAPRGRAFMSGVLLVLVVVALIAVVDLSPDEGDFPYYGDGTIFVRGADCHRADDRSVRRQRAGVRGAQSHAYAGVTAPIVLASDSGTETDPNASAVLGVGTEVSAGGITSAPLNANYQAAQQVLNTLHADVAERKLGGDGRVYPAPPGAPRWNPRGSSCSGAYTSFKLNSWTITGESATVSDSASFTRHCQYHAAIPARANRLPSSTTRCCSAWTVRGMWIRTPCATAYR